MIQNKRLDATFDDTNVIRYQALAKHMQDQIKAAGGFGINNDVLVGFSPQDSRSKELIKILETGLTKFGNKGGLQSILERYGMTDWYQ